MIQLDPYRPGVPTFRPFRAATVLMSLLALAKTTLGNRPYSVVTYVTGMPWLTAGMTLVPSATPTSMLPWPTSVTRSGSFLFWNVTSRPAAR